MNGWADVMEERVYWLENTDDVFWRECYDRLPKTTRDVYHHPDYIRLYTEARELASLFVYTRGADIYYYPFLKAPVSLANGFFDISAPYGYGGPIANTTDPIFIRQAYEAFYREAVERQVIAEVVKFHPLLGNSGLFTDIYRGRILKMCSTVYVDLAAGEDHLWGEIYTHANRKNINKARRQKIEVRFDQSDIAWQAFLKLYEETMIANNAAGFYFFSHEYYRGLREKLAGCYVLVSCWLDGSAIAAMLVLLGEVFAHCHLIGTNRQFLSTGVGNYLHHELISWCRAKGYKYLHIGGGRTDSDDDPLLLFKKNFSDATVPFHVGESILNEGVYRDVCARWENGNPCRQSSGHLLKYRY